MISADKVIFGSGIYGLYFALECAKRKEKVLVLEYDDNAFSRSSYLNQSRIHNGYHYPRSHATALKSAQYFERFAQDYPFSINKRFQSIYSISGSESKISASEFVSFCEHIDIPYLSVNNSLYFKDGMCESTFETYEYTYDAQKLKQYFLDTLTNYKNCTILFNSRTSAIHLNNNSYSVEQSNGQIIETNFILNATYGSTNQILHKAGFSLFDVKYELCEIILCEVSGNYKEIGITVMDGPFFSLIPFGNTGLHALSSVLYTPHKTTNNLLPDFSCQQGVECSNLQLQNCNFCPQRPISNWKLMLDQTREYLKNDLELQYKKSMFSVKTLLKSSETDDSRPTIVQKYSESPYFYTVLSGKINTIYDLDALLV
ncbi:MAG: NAD(P)/FAD-dependent oxidoreductase [Saprospiraceae bacterium]|nr:NAD(P)/FAD-dependent oxidoreductase [Saprospiraceae bacterium]MBL0025268.1 NAD(P)/FAD-dependent oxidoreductase [Saprospiraceae bacterium]